MEHKMYEQKKKQLRQIFYQMDRNGDGNLQKNEIEMFLADANPELGEDERIQLTEEIISNFDRNNDDMISLDEFAD